MVFYAHGKVIYKKSIDIGTIRILKNLVTNSDWDKLKAEIKANVKCNLPLLAIGSGGNINKIFSLTSRKLIYVEGSLNIELKNGKTIPWPSLSRGEKTLLALFLLVFLNRSGALFVLDEPDLSLHMEWQKMILPGLLSLAPTCQFIVATHSPFLVMNTGSEQVVNMAKLVMEAI